MKEIHRLFHSDIRGDRYSFKPFGGGFLLAASLLYVVERAARKYGFFFPLFFFGAVVCLCREVCDQRKESY